jgi:ankyrin repeat protein
MAPTDDDNDDLLSSCRYGDLDDVQDFVKKFGQESLAEVRDANGNNILHMVCGNGHLGEHFIRRTSCCVPRVRSD